MSRFRLSVRARILSIALIPSVTLLTVGVGASTYLAVEAFDLRDEVAQLSSATAPSNEFVEALQEERRFSMLVLSGDQSAREGLTSARERVDKVMTSPELLEAQTTIAEVAPETVGGGVDSADEVIKAFSQVRQGVDAGLAPPDQVLLLYNTVLDRVTTATRGVANALPDADAVAGASISVELADAVESMSRGNALAISAVNTMTASQLQDFTRQVGSYRNRLLAVTPALRGEFRERAEALVKSADWKTLASVENTIIERGTRPADGPPLPVSVADWQNAATTVNNELSDLYYDHYANVIDGAIDNAGDTATWWLVAGGAMLLGALGVALLTLRISAALIRRLRRLRAEALSLADEQLPRLMNRLRNGEDVDVNTEMRSLDFGTDEIGDVADAFNRAESAAVAAAVEEARTRGGINALFLNIAHRSQIVVHRQLELLDKAEHGEEDPTRLSVLFELDHLSTRARRNAENLIILGGEQPGRQWRNPVPLVDLARSAVAETEDYARVHVGPMANVSIVGGVVADLIHLIAELVENATSYSPPESRVDVTGNVVGRGAVIEIVDQGLGMAREQIAHANDVLREPPALSVSNLSSDSRMGLLVVSRIAARNGVTVKLSDSDYGGIRAIVLIPTTLLAGDEPQTRRPVGVGAPIGNGLVEANGAATRTGMPTSTAISPVPWPTMEPGEATPPPYPAQPELRAQPEPPRTHSEPRHTRREPVSAASHESLVSAAEQGIQPTAGRPALPRRSRQANLAPQLTNGPQTPQPQAGARRERSAERARDLFSEIETGTRQGRAARTEPGRNYFDGQEGLR